MFHEFTDFIKCGNCGENYGSKQTTYADGEKERYWRCAGKCGNESVKGSTMKKLTASVLGMDFFDEGEIDELLEKAVIQNGTVTFYFKDGHTEIRTYQERKRGYNHSKAYRAYMRELMQFVKNGEPESKAKTMELKKE